MVAGIITAVCGGFVGVGGFIFGIVKWKAEQKAKKEAARKAEEAEQKRLEEQTILKGVADMIAPIQEQNEAQSYAIEELRLQNETEMAHLKNLMDDNELDRLRAEIMQFVCYLRSGMNITSAEFKHIHHVYDKYHNMGGNSYIDGDFQYILEKEREYNESLR
jgi:hypothetical protein